MTSNYEKIGVLGTGYFGQVWKVKEKRSSETYAMKQPHSCHYDQRTAQCSLQNEAEIMKHTLRWGENYYKLYIKPYGIRKIVHIFKSTPTLLR